MNGPRYGALASLSRRVSPNDSLFLSYSFRRSFAGITNNYIHSLLGGWNSELRRRLPQMTLKISGGVSYFQEPGGVDDLGPIADVGLTSRLTRSTSFAIRYSRQYYSSYGFGRSLLNDYASANLSQMIATRIQLGVSAAYTQSTDPLEPGSKFTGERYAGNANFQITEGLSAGATYQVWVTSQQRIQPDSSELRSNLLSFFIRFTRRWPR